MVVVEKVSPPAPMGAGPEAVEAPLTYLPPIEEEEPVGIAKCIEELEHIEDGYTSETVLGLPPKDGITLLIVSADVLTDGERGRFRETAWVGDYEIEYVGTNADSRRYKRRFARILSIKPEPPFVVVIRRHREPGALTVIYKVVKPNCAVERPKVDLRGFGYVALRVGRESYIVPPHYSP